MNWTTKDGRKIPIKEMSDRHLSNTIAFLRRNAGQNILREMTVLNLGLATTNGEMAQDGIERELAALESCGDDEYLSEACPQFDALIEEAEKRGLPA